MVGYDLIIALVMMHHFAAKVTTDETFELGFTKQEKRGRDVGGSSSEVSSVGREWRLGGATSVCHHLARHCSRYCLGSHLSGWLAVHNLDQVLW